MRDGGYNNDDDNGSIIHVSVVDDNIVGISEEIPIADNLIGDGDFFTQHLSTASVNFRYFLDSMI